MYFNEKHKKIIENRGYIYIGTYERYEYTINSNICNKYCRFIRAKCKDCGLERDIRLDNLNKKDREYKCPCKYKRNNKLIVADKPKRVRKRVPKKRSKRKVSKPKLPYENSFAYYIQCELCDGLNKYWDWEKNTVNPYDISKRSSNIKIWLKCTNTDYHDSYQTYPKSFCKGTRCHYCSHALGKVHIRDSFGALYPEKAKCWSDKNNKSAYEVTCNVSKKYLFICEKCGKEFERSIRSVTSSGLNDVVCIKCNSSILEQSVDLFLHKNNITRESQKQFENLLGLGNGHLSYDFYLPDYNILLECQGGFHDGTAHQQSRYNFERQQEHDRRKKEYALNNGYKFLEIWYYDEKNIEDILIKELGLNKIA